MGDYIENDNYEERCLASALGLIKPREVLDTELVEQPCSPD